jgi:hypothetical protein
LLQRLRSASRGDVDAIDPASFDPVPSAIARGLDQAVSLIDEPARLRELISAALEEHGRHSLLLLRLAESERMYGDRHACATLAAEAMRGDPEVPLIVAGSIRELWLADYDADALRVIDGLSEQLMNSPAVGSAAGEICRYWRLRAHAITAFGRSGLEAWRWRMRRVCWWRSGGPVGRIRSSILAQENSLLSDLPLLPHQAAALSALALPTPIADAVRGDLAAHNLIRTHLMVFRPGVLNDWLDRTFVPASTVIVFAALTLAERLRWPSAGIAHGLIAAALATAAEAATLRILLGKTTRRWATRISIAAACGIGAAFLLRNPAQLAFGAGLALGALAFVIMAGYVLQQATHFARSLRVARWQRGEAETGVLSALLNLLGQLIVPQLRRDAGVRRIWMADLERVAITIERDLPHALRSRDPDSQSAIAAHARSAATALRGMKRIVALPDEASWQDLIDRLTGLAAALARHDFGSWPPPLPEATTFRSPRPLWRQVLDAGRTMLVIFIPPLVAYLLPLVVPLSGPGLSWLRFATVVWVLLGVLIALDPAWTDRIAKMRQGLELLRNAAPPKGADGSPTPYGPADTAPLQAPDAQRQTPARRARRRSRR